MKIVIIILSMMLLSGCSHSYDKDAKGNYILSRVINKTGVGITVMVPESWGEKNSPQDRVLVVGSKNGHGFDGCSVGFQENVSNLVRRSPDDYKKELIRRFNKGGKVEITKIYDSSVESGKLHKHNADMVILHGQVKSLKDNLYMPVTIYGFQKKDFSSRNIAMYCFSLGKDGDGIFKAISKEIAKNITENNI